MVYDFVIRKLIVTVLYRMQRIEKERRKDKGKAMTTGHTHTHNRKKKKEKERKRETDFFSLIVKPHTTHRLSSRFCRSSLNLPFVVAWLTLIIPHIFQNVRHPRNDSMERYKVLFFHYIE